MPEAMSIVREDDRFPRYGPAERRADAVVHALGVPAAITDALAPLRETI